MKAATRPLEEVRADLEAILREGNGVLAVFVYTREDIGRLAARHVAGDRSVRQRFLCVMDGLCGIQARAAAGAPMLCAGCPKDMVSLADVAALVVIHADCPAPTTANLTPMCRRCAQNAVPAALRFVRSFSPDARLVHGTAGTG